MQRLPAEPDASRAQPAGSYDVVIVGGAIMGSATAWFLARDPDFDGRICVIERDPTYEWCSTAHTNSCIRQQFSTALNVRISQFGASFVSSLRERMGGDERVPDLAIRNFGYLYLAADEAAAQVLWRNRDVQRAAGAQTRLLDRDEIAAAYPFYRLDDIVLGSINTVDEGYFDGWAVFEAFRRGARRAGVDYVSDEVVGMDLNAARDRVERVRLKSGASVGCGQLVNASGPRAARTAAMAGIDLPVEPRKRLSWIFSAQEPLDRPLPLTIDPTGIHVRDNGGGTYLCGAKPADDRAVDPGDFDMDHEFFEDHVWPILADRIPQFEAIKVTASWAGHYAYNVVDQNAIVGPDHGVGNFIFQNGFSGHGLQQAPAIGRGVAEWLVHGRYRTLDLTEFHADRLSESVATRETAVI